MVQETDLSYTRHTSYEQEVDVQLHAHQLPAHAVSVQASEAAACLLQCL